MKNNEKCIIIESEPAAKDKNTFGGMWLGEEYVDGTTGLKYVRFIGCIVLMAAIFSAYLHIILIGYKLKSVINGADRIMPISYESSGNDYAAARETFSG